MNDSENDLDLLWRKVHQGIATKQDCVDAAALAGRSGDPAFVPYLQKLIKDADAQVRYYALQSLVIDLQQRDPQMQEHCMYLLRKDPDEQVRSMAATCLGKIFFGTLHSRIFRQLLAELKSPDQPQLAKHSLYVALFQVAGRPPLEWPGLLGAPRVFGEKDIDWEKVAWLQDQMENV